MSVVNFHMPRVALRYDDLLRRKSQKAWTLPRSKIREYAVGGRSGEMSSQLCEMTSMWIFLK